MRRLAVLVRGTEGHPLHPPLTDVTIGAFTVGTVAAVFAWFGLASDSLVPTAFTALVIGLLAAVPTVVTGLVDLLHIPTRAAARTTAVIHMAVMLSAGSVYLVASLLLRPGLENDAVSTAAAVAAVAGFALLLVGGWIGGSLVFTHGIRVVGDRDTPTSRERADAAARKTE